MRRRHVLRPVPVRFPSGRAGTAYVREGARLPEAVRRMVAAAREPQQRLRFEG